MSSDEDEHIYSNVNPGNHDNPGFEESPAGSKETVSGKRDTSPSGSDDENVYHTADEYSGSRGGAVLREGFGKVILSPIEGQRETKYPGDYSLTYNPQDKDKYDDIGLDPEYSVIPETGVPARSDRVVTFQSDKEKEPYTTISSEPYQGHPYTSVTGETESESEGHGDVRRHPPGSRGQSVSRGHRLSQRISRGVSRLWVDRKKKVCGFCTRCCLCVGALLVLMVVLGLAVALFFTITCEYSQFTY